MDNKTLERLLAHKSTSLDQIHAILLAEARRMGPREMSEFHSLVRTLASAACEGNMPGRMDLVMSFAFYGVECFAQRLGAEKLGT